MTFAASAGMSATATGAVISKITIAESQTLTVTGSNDITCNSVVKTSATLTDSGTRLVDAAGDAWVNK